MLQALSGEDSLEEAGAVYTDANGWTTHVCQKPPFKAAENQS